MITETYRITKHNSELDAMLEDGDNQLLREKLELAPVTRKEQSAPFKFRPITTEEKNVFKLLFEKNTPLENYREFIPNEVLEAVVEFKETCPYYHLKFKVMSPAEYDPDPVLVCELRDKRDEYSWANKEYLVARWGDALAPFAELKAKATEIFRDKRRRALKNVVKEAQDGLEQLDDTFDLASLRSVDIPYVSNLKFS